MPAVMLRTRQTGTPYFKHTCEVCNKPACFGVGVSFLKALKLLKAASEEEKAEGRRLLGKWYCGEHREKEI